ncbi:MAG TPA: enolase C-terminal domain-like protein, partial [Chloroflexota bacterium]|nr:enolase C-terminal domain-like protein [Chloroflexota bacterium]
MKIERIEWGRLEGTRPRKAGKNARLDDHGLHVRPPIARLTLSDGSSGFGVSRGTREQLQEFVGRSVDELFSSSSGVAEAAQLLDYPLWDLAAKRAGLPVYALAAKVVGRALPEGALRVRCYDTTLYFDDLHLDSNEEAAALIAQEAREGYERGHRAFKVKIGRGARHMELEKGTRRDILILRAIREAVGPEPPMMVDANNGYNLNLSKRVLAETADVRVFWLEEAFHEDAVLYRDLKEWLGKEGLETLIAD